MSVSGTEPPLGASFFGSALPFLYGFYKIRKFSVQVQNSHISESVSVSGTDVTPTLRDQRPEDLHPSIAPTLRDQEPDEPIQDNDRRVGEFSPTVPFPAGQEVNPSGAAAHEDRPCMDVGARVNTACTAVGGR